MTSLNKRLLPLTLLVATVSLVFAGISPVQGTPVQQIRVGATTVVPAGSLTTTTINAKFMGPFDAFDIAVVADPTVLDPQGIAIGGMLPSPVIFTNCVDGAGLGCSITDTGGVAHLVALSGTGAPTTTSSGVLFTVTWKAMGGAGTVIGINCQLVASAGTQLSVSIVDGTYGTVSTSSLPNYTVTFSSSSLSVPAGTSTSTTVFINALNGFAQDVAIRTTTSDASVKATLDTSSVTCNCISVAMATLTVHTSIHGTFTVTVQGLSTQPARVVNSGTITVTA